jgi:hypothetical protein
MKGWQAVLLALALIVSALVLAVSRRYSVEVRNDGGLITVYRTDAWTGDVVAFVHFPETEHDFYRRPITRNAPLWSGSK